MFKRLKSRVKELVLIVVPRHPHRFDEVNDLCCASGFSTQRLSNKSDKQSDIVLIDAMGWLKACYCICDVAFIGGSFATKGGHNPLEAALYAKPMVMGPSIFNNPEICQKLTSSGALEILQEKTELFDALNQRFTQQDKSKHDGFAGEQVLKNSSGAVDLTISFLDKYL